MKKGLSGRHCHSHKKISYFLIVLPVQVGILPKDSSLRALLLDLGDRTWNHLQASSFNRALYSWEVGERGKREDLF